MVRLDEKRQITSIHTSLLTKIEEGPILDGELAELYGSNYVNLIEDLLANDYPIWSEGTDWEDLTIKIYYYEAPGQESALCPVCSLKTRSLGPFCSAECESRFVSTAMADWKRRKTERRVKRPISIDKIELPRMENYEPVARRSLHGRGQLSNIIPAATIIHLSKKASLNKKLDQSERNSLSYIGGRMYRDEVVTETERKVLESILEKGIQAGIATDPCPNGNCERCKGLVDILLAHGILKKSSY
jgi:hypothetical protein